MSDSPMADSDKYDGPHDLQERLDRLREQYADCMQALGQANARADAAEADRDRLARVIAEVRGSLSEVAVFDGILEFSPTALAVAELVRDHGELEARIEAALSDMAHYEGKGEWELLEGPYRLLRGAPRVPDTPEGLE